jgi:hypothetical protein
LNGHIVFLILAGSSHVSKDSPDILPKKNAPIAGNVLEDGAVRNSIDRAGMARKIGCPELVLDALFCAGEPDFLAGGSPINDFDARLPRG